MSKRKSGRNVHGIVLLDKRLGVSSNKALQEVRRLFNANKAGHAGTLDPLATGLLPLCFGEATKVSALMLDHNKRYQVVIQLGVMTNTGDAEGVITETEPVPDFSIDEVQACIKTFMGEIEQIPPMYSALKYNGKKLYELAREGKTIERKVRHVFIFDLKILSFFKDRLILDVYCSKGTYIRTLAEDIGHALGCGGTVTALRRLEAGQFTIEQAKTIEELKAMNEHDLFECLINVDQPLEALPSFHLTDEQAIAVKYGQSINLLKSPNDNLGMLQGAVRMYHAAVFLGLGEMLLDGKIAPKKLFNMSNE